MSRKRTKQYLMLLMVVGLVSIAAGGGGTFASFSAETTNAGNYFATGSLVLNDNGGVNTCTSATATGSVNTANSSSTDCDTLFKVKTFQFASTTLTTPNPLDSTAGASAALVVGAITGSAIYPGDTLTITDGTNTDTMVAKSYAAVGATAVTVDATTLTDSFAAGATITDNSDTQFASLTLTNAGSIDANGIKFEAANGCSHQYADPTTTLNMGAQTLGSPSGTTLTIASTGTARFQAGDTLIVSEGTHANSFVVVSQSSATSVTVDATQNWNFNYDTSAVVSGPEFNGAGNAAAHNLCSHLTFSVIQTSSGFNQDLSGASKCSYGDTSAPLAHASACNFGSSTDLSLVPTTLTPLDISTTDGGNTSGELNAGKSRTFLLAVHYDGSSSFDNTYQNTTATAFDLTWHIDQV